MKYILYLGLLSLIILVSCNKNEKKEITPDLLNLCFKTDSYWVYIDSVNIAIDSVYVVSHNHYYYEEYVTDYTSYDIEKFNFTTESTSSLSLMYSIEENFMYANLSANLSKGTSLYVDYDNFVEPEPNSGYEAERLESFFIYDQYYSRILKVEVTEDEIEDNNKSIYYINSNYGILRHDIYSDTVLLSSKILMRKNIVR